MKYSHISTRKNEEEEIKIKHTYSKHLRLLYDADKLMDPDKYMCVSYISTYLISFERKNK